MRSIYHLGPLMNVCPEWLCAIVREAERARNDSWWKDEGGERRRKEEEEEREDTRWRDEEKGEDERQSGESRIFNEVACDFGDGEKSRKSQKCRKMSGGRWRDGSWEVEKQKYEE